MNIFSHLDISMHPGARNGRGNVLSKLKLSSLNIPKFPVPGKVKINGTDFQYHDARCFYDTYKEIFVRKMYAFHTENKQPYIVDCGANMGLSVLYFSTFYPGATVVAFEPEPPIFDILKKNVQAFNLKNVELHKKAVWNEATTLEFFTDHGMAGSITNVFENQKPYIVETVKLADFLQRKTDMLKMDIEGAEFDVLESCRANFENIERMFVEYHSFENKTQKLDDLLLMLKDAGFRYHLSQSFSYKQPFVENTLACEHMDLAINIFAYRNK